MSKHIDNGLEYEIVGNEAILLGFASSSSKTINQIPDMQIPDFVRGVPVTKITKRAFEKVEELETITIPSTIKEIETCAFLGCQHLQKITMSCPRAKKDALKIGASAFAYCFSLDEVDIFCRLEIESRAFLGCDKLTKVSGLIFKVAEGAFRDCNRIYMLNLEHDAEIKFDAFYESTIENIRCMGDITLSTNDIWVLVKNGTMVLCYDDSKTADLAYCGVAISCQSRS